MSTIILLLLSLSSVDLSYQDQSTARLSNLGYTFTPYSSASTPLLTLAQSSILRCHMQCNPRIACRLFDYDSDTNQCRLWSDDLTTGMISLAIPSKPQSRVGVIRIAPYIYTPIHNQPCDKCTESRYEECDPFSLTCQCPSVTFWNGNVCSPQRYLNQSCATIDSCRSDLALECRDVGCNSVFQCLNQTNVVTVAGFCNATVGGGAYGLSGPWGLYVTSNNTLYVTDYDTGRVQAYAPSSRSGVTIAELSGHVEDIFMDSMGCIYVVDITLSSVFISPMNTTLPIAIQRPCTSSSIYDPYGIAVDRYGNIYISDFYCNVVTKWAPNTTAGIVVAGQLNTAGSTSSLLNGPKFIALDEVHSALYVVDYYNCRVQKFLLGVSTVGTTVAGGNGYGTGLNQLKNPSGVCVLLKDQSVYVGDQDNHRVVKWVVNATQGSIVAGVTGVAGNTSSLLNTPGDCAFDPTETFLYVADYGNHRVQRFSL
ncbi:unnamed protein product [Adineta ricciae]|uniref:Apple domain-containing protein n=1 Tax=Adineta ricciae TaxID=249248 RepID=A0A815QBW7_ADIRI|nr:unnamed protein product [Adineta ricciae]CAF1461113.1 unnamed protein product [Adineta ricciae]